MKTGFMLPIPLRFRILALSSGYSWIIQWASW
jgi:hypothetical protein